MIGITTTRALPARPLKSFANTADISGVACKSSRLSRDELDRVLEGVAERVK